MLQVREGSGRPVSGNSIPGPSVCRGFVSFLSLLLGSVG